MTSHQCTCIPFICPKCPGEHKSLTVLKQYLINKHNASTKQSLLVAQKLIRLKLNCKKCIQNSQVSVYWCALVCFPTEQILQDHIKTAHKSVNRSKNERSNSRQSASDCTCLQIFQCPGCPRCYHESSHLEEHWQSSGHLPENSADVLNILRKQAQVVKSNSCKCTRESHIQKNSDVCLCRKAYICSVCLESFSCYFSLKRHWTTINHHLVHDSIVADVAQSECLSCVAQVSRDLIRVENPVTVSCSESETLSDDEGSIGVKHLTMNNLESELHGIRTTSRQSKIESEKIMSQLPDKLLAIDTDDDSNNDDDDDRDTFSTSACCKQPLSLSRDLDCICPILKCTTCSCCFFKCHDLYQHMKDFNHLNLNYFKAARKEKKTAKSLCFKHSAQEIINRKKLKTSTSIMLHKENSYTNGTNNINKVKHINSKPLLNRNPTKLKASSLHHALGMQRKREPSAIEASSSKIDSSRMPSPDTSNITVPSNIPMKDFLTDVNCGQINYKFGMVLDASVLVKESVSDADFDTDDLVTITISDSNVSHSSPDVTVTTSSLFARNCLDMQGCFQQCLKLITSDCTCSKINFASPQENSAIQHKTGCLTCCSEISCFLCPDIFSSYDDFKEHYSHYHFVQFRPDELFKPSENYVEAVFQQLNTLNCICTDLKCKLCPGTFMKRLPLLHHVLIDHPYFYSVFPFFLSREHEELGLGCPRCLILENLCIVNYYLFVKVLIKIEGSSDDEHKPVLQWSPQDSDLANTHMCQPSTVCGTDSEVVCYCIIQHPDLGKIRQDIIKRGKLNATTECICPLLKCPQCPKVTANFGDLRKHTRINSHNLHNNMKYLWEKYKMIKENCPACSRYLYLNFSLCPHCPHLTFEDEDAAQSHMGTVHRGLTGEHNSNIKCKCGKVFLCMTCTTYYRTPQGLHHHMRRLGHETRENFDAIPGMIRTRMNDKRKCPRCSLLVSSKTLDVMSVGNQEQCSCQWAICNTCGNSYKKISALVDHMKKVGHPLNSEYIKCEQKKLIASLKACQKCSNMEDRYCIFCNTRENFIYHHMRTHHHDRQIMLLTGENGELLSEYDLSLADSAKYECSVCLKRFLHTTTLRHHVRKIHPDSYFTLQHLDLSNDTIKIEDFTARKELKIIALRNKTRKTT